MKLRITTGSEAGRVVEPNPAGFSIGRGQDNDLVLPGEGMSRHHCRLEETPDGWVVEDLGSVNGVRVDGQRVEGQTVLTNGSTIDICGQMLEVELDEAPARMIPSTPSPDAEPTVVSAPSAVPEPTVVSAPPAAPEPPPIVVHPETADGKSQLPWGRIALLVAMCALIGALVYLLLSGGDKTTDKPVGKEAEAKATEATDGNGATPPPPALNDQDLDRLLKEEAALAAKEPPKDDTTAGAPAAAATTTTTTTTGTEPAPPPPAAATEPKTEPVSPAPEATDHPAATDMVLVRSTPEGATILIDDEEKGTTPALITGLAKGRHRVTLRLDGYEDQQRLIHVPDLPAPSPYLLRQRPNTLHVTSDPPGVSIWRGSQWLGVAPVLLQDLPAGEMTLTLALAGCPPQRRKVTISAVRGEQLQVEMKPPVGTLEIDTVPPGCQVLVDGVLMGTTAATGKGPGTPGQLVIPNLLAGERLVRVEHPCGASLAGKLPVTAGSAIKRMIQLWVPDTQVTLLDGKVSTGMLRERNAQGDIVLALTPRASDMVRYLKPRIREERALTEAETEAAFRKIIAPEPEAKQPKEGNEPEPKAPTGIADNWGDAVAPDAPGDGKGDALAGKVVELPAEDLTAQVERYPKSKLLQRYKGTTLLVTGKATAVRRDGLTGVVTFGRRIRCEMDRDTFSAEQEKLNALQETDASITMRGHIQGFLGDRLVLRDCRPVYGPSKAEPK